jgi:DNA primase
MEEPRMSEPTPDPTPEPEAKQGEPADKPLGENGEKALKAERDARAAAEKTAAALQKQLDDINAANLSDLEKAQKAAQDAQDLANKASAEALRYRIAAETGITENVDLILTASDEETMRRQAALWGERTSGNTPAGPRPDLSQGGKGKPAAGTPEQDFANFMGQALAH